MSIARALANQPRLLLADEPTANLDSRHGHGVMQVLHDLAKNQGRTAVVVSTMRGCATSPIPCCGWRTGGCATSWLVVGSP